MNQSIDNLYDIFPEQTILDFDRQTVTRKDVNGREHFVRLTDLTCGKVGSKVYVAVLSN